jgi:transposase
MTVALTFLSQHDRSAHNPKQGQLLTPHQRTSLLNCLNADLRPEYCRRIKIMLLADMGWSQTQICEALQCSHETARYWIQVAKVGQAENWHDLSVGRPRKVDDEYLARLKDLVNRSPREYGYSFRRWTAQWLNKQLAKEFGVEVSDRHINRLLKKMGISTKCQNFAADGEANQLNGVVNIVTGEAGFVISNLQSSSTESPKTVWLFNPIESDQSDHSSE